MPSSSDTAENSKPTPRKRAVRKRATRVKSDKAEEKKRVTKSTPTKTASRRTVPAAEPEIRVPEQPSSGIRKAPTPFASNKERALQKKKRIMVVVVLFAIGVGASAMVGFTDSGQIDVQQTIEDRNERIRNNTATEQDTINSKIEVPVQDTSKASKPGGGLKGRGIVEPLPVPEPELEVPTTTASTTDDGTASTTEEVIETDTKSESETEVEESDSVEETELSEE